MKDILELRITLLGIDPPIWRLIRVPDDFALDQLHDAIQDAMGWEDCHLHSFRKGKTTYGPADQLADSGDADEAGVTLAAVFPRKGSKLEYEYDFGDSWHHEIVLVDRLHGDKRMVVPTCIGGERACPPEDSGGVWGDQDKLENLAGPAGERDEELIEWLGEGFDPEVFDVTEVNARYAQWRRVA